MTAVWLLLIGGLLLGWLLSWQRQQREIRTYQIENQKLHKASGGLEQTLARRGRRLDVLFSAVNEAVMRVDRLGRVMAANQRARELFEVDQGPELPQALLLFYRDRDWLRAFSGALKNLPEAAVLPEIKVAGRVLVPRLAPLGREQAMLLCVDMTDMYKLEAQRRTFLSNLMHDLKTPLTSLLGYARSLDSFADDAEFRKEAVQVIADEAKHVNHLLDALLTLDQIEFSVRDDHASCHFNDILRQVFDMLAPACTEKHIQLIRGGGQSDHVLAIVNDDLERILTNLLVNAVTYSLSNSQVEVSVNRIDSRCAIVIEDSGEGIPQADLSRVTERFYQVDKARTRKDGGHGLGLAIVKELAEKNEGSLELSNRKDGGLLVKVTLSIGVE